MPSENADFFSLIRKYLASSCGSKPVNFLKTKSGYATTFAIFRFILPKSWLIVYNTLVVLRTDKL